MSRKTLARTRISQEMNWFLIFFYSPFHSDFQIILTRYQTFFITQTDIKDVRWKKCCHSIAKSQLGLKSHLMQTKIMTKNDLWRHLISNYHVEKNWIMTQMKIIFVLSYFEKKWNALAHYFEINKVWINISLYNLVSFLIGIFLVHR